MTHKRKNQFKYSIEEQIGKLPRTISLNTLIGKLAKYGIARRTFYRDRAILIADDEDISVERLVIYATVFGCDVNDLINYKAKAKPIVEHRFKSPLAKPLN